MTTTPTQSAADLADLADLLVTASRRQQDMWAFIALGVRRASEQVGGLDPLLGPRWNTEDAQVIRDLAAGAMRLREHGLLRRQVLSAVEASEGYMVDVATVAARIGETESTALAVLTELAEDSLIEPTDGGFRL
ncbi:hypothetical protein [Barrientosiimonas endolithica]|uniref:DprA winged helix domain-containing protein n=1 Tax=Barrientosiimonas endolithica TaxID=1535208 RepID=A0ABN6YKD4_9MICO|nr:hypothetical protein [Barrientosiimonas endolithica]BDZ56595.1 hypothetical protein GCM10025872_02520 [Barrientosiimonas endolithica]